MADILLTTGLLFVLALYGAIGWAVIAKYRKSGNPGFLILGAGVIVAPVLSRLVDLGVEAALERRTFSLVTEGVLSIGQVVALSGYAPLVLQGALILWGILLIGRGRRGVSGRMMAAEAR